MSTPELSQLYLSASCDNQEAYQFLVCFYHLNHGVDDIIDNDNRESLGVNELFILAKNLYSSKFFIEHREALSMVADLLANAYEDSNDWNADSSENWQLVVANVLRSQHVDMVLAVANICGGYRHMRSLSKQLRTLSFKHQNL